MPWSMAPTVRVNHTAGAVAWLQPVGLAVVFFVPVATLAPAVLRDGMFLLFLGIVVVSVVMRVRPDRKPVAAPPRYALDLVLIGLVSLALSSVYWYRVALVMTGWDYIAFRAITSLAWWLPGVAFAALYRHPGRAWASQGRGRFFARLLVAALAALPALPIQDLMHDRRVARNGDVAADSHAFVMVGTAPSGFLVMAVPGAPTESENALLTRPGSMSAGLMPGRNGRGL